MNANETEMLSRKRRAVVSRWGAMILGWSAVWIAGPAWASNPWGRAVGEAQCLQDVTEDLRNRAHRLFPNCPATALTCPLDESACRIVEMVKCGADWGSLQAALRGFETLKAHLCHAVAADCHMSRDRAIAGYLRRSDDRFDDLVRDLSKCKIPPPSCYSPYPSARPSFPSIPPLSPHVPPYWQGSIPDGSAWPRSTYDFDRLAPTSIDGSRLSPYEAYGIVPIDRSASFERQRADQPSVATEILGWILSRALR